MTDSGHQLERTRPGETELLYRRMIVLRLDIEAWARTEPILFGDLQKACAACASRQQCAYDLVAHFSEPGWRDWREYCPNATKLNLLTALQSFLKPDLAIDQAIERFGSHPQAAPVETD